MGAEELRDYVKAVMKARGLTVAGMQRMTGISRPTLTDIKFGRYAEGSEKTRETLDRLAEGLDLERDELFAAAGLDPDPPTKLSTIPVEMLDRMEAAERALAEAAAAIRAVLEEQRRSLRPPPQPPKRPGGSRTRRTRPPEGGPQSNFRRGSPGR